MSMSLVVDGHKLTCGERILGSSAAISTNSTPRSAPASLLLLWLATSAEVVSRRLAQKHAPHGDPAVERV